MAAHAGMSHGLVVLLAVIIYLSCTKAGVQSTMQQLEVQHYLKRLNKPAIKSIKSPDGDIIDCVHITQQPAFDHPLLKDHAIQMRPTFHPFDPDDENEVASKKKTSSSVTQLWHKNGRCPESTIPIRRTKKEDVLRASSIQRFGKKSSYAVPRPNAVSNRSTHEHSFAYVVGGKYYGARVFMDVWNPHIQEKDEFSVTQLWIIADPQKDQNTIEVGWHVHPPLYGDTKTRLFSYWTTDNFNQTGCYNLFCSGFVQVSKDMAMGATIYPLSSYGGRQYGIDLTIFKEPQTGNWWLTFGNKTLGYWPSSIFSHLSYATAVLWGGEAVNSRANGKHTSTQMGSGHFAGEGYGKASFCSNLKILDQALTQLDPKGIKMVSESPNCYNLQDATNSGDLKTHFYYGGPGINPKCP